MLIIKIGGARGIDYDRVLEDLAALLQQGEKIILVHGGKSELEDFATRLGEPPQWVTTASGYTSRRTDRKTMESFIMIYAGKMNKLLVEKLHGLGVNAVGLCGMDGKLVVAKKKNIVIVEHEKKKVLRDDYTGTIVQVNKELLDLLLTKGFLPVICPPALGEENEALNVDGDRLAARIAEAFHAETVVYLSNVPGLLKDRTDESSLIKHIPKEKVDAFMQFAHDTMKKKVMGAVESLHAGVKRVVFADARIDKPITKALQGAGTVID